MNREDLFEAFRIAIDREQEAYEFYTSLAEKSGDEMLSEIFSKFAQEEAQHNEKLRELYSDLRDRTPED